jgi:hypothetical protein
MGIYNVPLVVAGEAFVFKGFGGSETDLFLVRMSTTLVILVSSIYKYIQIICGIVIVELKQ